MRLLTSNFPPVRTSHPSYSEVFFELLSSADEACVATGYVSEESVADLTSTIVVNGGPKLTLFVGMHLFDGISQNQYNGLSNLHRVLSERNLGAVAIAHMFPFHGKASVFTKEARIIGALAGSSNLSNIVPGNHRQYEIDHHIEPGIDAQHIHDLLRRLVVDTSIPFNEAEFNILHRQPLSLAHIDGVDQVEQSQVDEMKQRVEFSFEIPLKADGAPKSNLNTFQGKGRANQQGYVIPRSWYEVELIVPKSITVHPEYPQADASGSRGVFSVVTDDGWTFRCKVSGDFSKNLRSEHDLKILGRWIKGRLENAGALMPGEPVTNAILQRYGRDSLTLSKIVGSDKWLLDFSI